MKVIKDYKLFVESINNNVNEGLFTGFKDLFKGNEGVDGPFKKMTQGIKDKLSSIWSNIVSDKKIDKKDEWWYLANSLQSEQKPDSSIQAYMYSAKSDPKYADFEEYTKKTDVQKLKHGVSAQVQAQVQAQSQLQDLEKEETLSEKKIVDLKHPNKNVVNVDADELKELLLDAFELKVTKSVQESDTEQRSLFIWGAPGIGKTDILKQVCNKLGVDLIVWHLSQIAPEDFMGLPGIEKDEDGNKRSVFYLPKMFPTSNGPSDKGVVLFFDEINRAREVVLSAALGLCLEGKIGNYTLPSKCLVVAAGNRREDVEGVTAIEPALANRFQHVNYRPYFQNWEDWASTIGSKKIHGDILGFLQDNKQYWHLLDTDAGGGEGDPAWASPRSWTKASEAYIQKLKHGDIPQQKLVNIIGGFVGIEAATAFANWVELKKHFSREDFQKVWSDPTKARRLAELKRPDIQRAVAVGISYFIDKNTPLTDKQIENIFTYAMREDSGEMATILLGNVKRAHPEILQNKEWIKQLKVFNPWVKSKGVKKF